MAGRRSSFLNQWRPHAAGGGLGSTVPADAPPPQGRLIGRAYERLGRIASRLSGRPVAVTGGVLALNLGLAALLAPLGYAVTGDRAVFFRELMPGTWLSFAALVLVSGIAWEIHVRERVRCAGGARDDHSWRRYDDFWALSAGAFAVLALDEITQATLFLSHWLSPALELSAPAPFADVDAVLLLVLLASCAIVVARRAAVLLGHRRAVALLAVGAILGMASQAIDSFFAVSEWETVVEETLKLAAVPFFVGGYLTALHDVARRTERPAP